ncbi:uncharacterized protein RAG0_06720 [Rhynchosporium agropyri]|uniref:Uncharacterized protein n=1 Tax=Rhynchosporium agropyri TaxID=914238 RepID=A0A1E1KIG9_9HELO|nr:uncharacterized protein RAG0_06720 [Rhynchosporium agropyri]
MREDTITDPTDPAIRRPNNPPLRSYESSNTFIFLLRCSPPRRTSSNSGSSNEKDLDNMISTIAWLKR